MSGTKSIEPSDSREEIDVGEFLHLVYIALCFDYFFVIEEDPGFFFFASDFFGGDRFADEGYVVSGVIIYD